MDWSIVHLSSRYQPAALNWALYLTRLSQDYAIGHFPLELSYIYQKHHNLSKGESKTFLNRPQMGNVKAIGVG